MRLRVNTGAPTVRLGLRQNLAQFSLLVAINAFVGAMVQLETKADLRDRRSGDGGEGLSRSPVVMTLKLYRHVRL